MMSFSLHPKVYATGQADGLLRMLEQVWVRDFTPGDGTIYIISGFGTYNGGVRFYPAFEDHTAKGGQIVSFFAGSTAQRLTSKQVVDEMLRVGAEVNIINRKRLLHAKCYGTRTSKGDRLIVTSGNFTGPGMSQNVESSVLLDVEHTRDMNFSWLAVENAMKQQAWDTYLPTAIDANDPRRQLLYDETARDVILDETEEITLLITLSHMDTYRINAAPRTDEALGTQYFFLSKDSYGFFPPLTIRNKRGRKASFQCLVTIHVIDLKETITERVTFEAENNLDFRLGTNRLKSTQIAEQGDLAAISRTGEDVYELRIFRKNTPLFEHLSPYAINFIGHKGKQYGYIDNEDFTQVTGIHLPSVPRAGFS
jgi:hypothetical protein